MKGALPKGTLRRGSVSDADTAPRLERRPLTKLLGALVLLVPLVLGSVQTASAAPRSSKPSPTAEARAADAAVSDVAGLTARQIAKKNAGQSAGKGRPDYSRTVISVDRTPTGALGGQVGDMSINDLVAHAPHPAGVSPQRRTATAPASSATPLAAGQDDMTIDECRSHDQAFSGQGWGKSRFVSCQAHGLHFLQVDCWFWGIGCRITGAADVDVTDIQYTLNGARFVDVVQTYSNWFVWKKMHSQDLVSNVTCSAQKNSGSCDPWVFVGPYTSKLGAMSQENGGFATRFYDFEQPKSAGWGPDSLSYAALSWHFTAPGAEPSQADGPESQFRCDSATYIVNSAAGEGCVFPWVTETMQFSVAQSGQAANHILDALYHTDETLPEKAGKVIPGRPGTQPLHRTTDEALIEAHRDVAIPTCEYYFPDYAKDGLDCDEFPFASTLEGATDDDNFSVEPIPAADNRSGGGVMSNFYTYRRIIGDDTDQVNDPFYVDVGP